MSVSTFIASASIGNKIAKAAIPFIAGCLICSAFFCAKTSKTKFITRTDTVIIDTSKIVEHTPIIVKNISLFIRDTVTCEAALPPFALSEGDTLSIGRVNSCKGIFENIRLVKKPDTVRFQTVKVIQHNDTVREPLFVFSKEKLFQFGVNAKLGSGFGILFQTGLDVNASLGKWGLYLSPEFDFIDKFHFIISGGVTYKIL